MKHFLLVLYGISLFFMTSSVFAQKVQAKALFSDTMTAENPDSWKEVRNFQWLNRSEKCQKNSQPAIWEYGYDGAGMSVQGNPCLATLATKNLNLFNIPSYIMDFRMKTMMPIQADRSFSFRWLDDQNYYGVQINGQRVEIFKIVNGVQYNLPNAVMFIPFASNAMYDVSVQVYEDHSIRLKIADREIYTKDTPPYLRGGGIAIQAGVGADNTSFTTYKLIGVRTLDEDVVLDVPSILQTDEAWKNSEYDSAKKWTTNSTIGRWGCALTSAVMILKYHGFTELPDHSPLTPDSLNSWLKAQKDGYIGKGFINWLAIARMTGIIKKNSPEKGALEYSKSVFKADVVKNKLAMNEPVITELPGHFVTLIGTTPNDFVINDPLNQHNTVLKDTNKSPIGARYFHPSHTDLSGLLIEVPSGITGQLWLNGVLQIAEPLTPYVEDQESAQVFELLGLSQNDTVSMSFRNSLGESIQLPIFSYASDGTLVNNTLTLEPQASVSQSWQYQKTDGTLVPSEEDHTWENRVKEAKVNRSFFRESEYRKTLEIAKQIDKQSILQKRLRYLRRLKTMLNNLSNPNFSQKAKWLEHINEEFRQNIGNGGP